MSTFPDWARSSAPDPAEDLPQPREAPFPPPSQSAPALPGRPPAPSGENTPDTLPPGGAEATLSAPDTGTPATITLGPDHPPCPVAPALPPLGWTGLRPPAPVVVDCRAGAWQQVYVPPGSAPRQSPPVAPAPQARVGLPWYRCCHEKYCSQGVGNWKRPAGAVFPGCK